MKRVMIIDALNAYLRAYIVDPSLSSNGQPIGGIKGFLKILQKLVRDMNPDQVVVCGMALTALESARLWIKTTRRVGSLFD